MATATYAPRHDRGARSIDALVEFGAERDERLAARRRFEDLDVDSLDLVELAQIVEDEYGVELKGADVEEVEDRRRRDRPGRRERASDDPRASSSPGVGAVTPLGRRRRRR